VASFAWAPIGYLVGALTTPRFGVHARVGAPCDLARLWRLVLRRESTSLVLPVGLGALGAVLLLATMLLDLDDSDSIVLVATLATCLALHAAFATRAIRTTPDRKARLAPE
jgi:hypothetical protein